MSSWALADHHAEQGGVLAVSRAPLHMLTTLCKWLPGKESSWKTAPDGIGRISIRGRNVIKQTAGVSQCGPLGCGIKNGLGGVGICASAALGERNGLERVVLGITETASV
jgi:hypothetical protein